MEEKKENQKVEKQEKTPPKKEKANLNDIILDKMNSNKKPMNIKKMLLTIAFMILLFLIVLLIMKFINSSNKEPEANLIPPESVTQSAITQNEETLNSNEEKEKKESVEQTEEVFKEAPVAEEKENFKEEEVEGEDSFDEMVKSLKEKEIASVKQTKKENKTNKKEIEEKVKEVVEPKALKEVKKEVKESVKEAVKTVKKESAIKKEAVKVKKEKVIKEKIVKSCPAPVKVNKMRGYFVQVSASFKTLPTKEFLRKIERNGFRYIIKKSIVRGQRATKVLIGPYRSKEEALRDLPKIKNIINPEAFVLRIK